MSDDTSYTPASMLRRFGSFLVNMMLFCMVLVVCRKSVPEVIAGGAGALGFVLALIFGGIFVSPGKRVFDLVVLGAGKKPISWEVRLARSAPILAFFFFGAMRPWAQGVGSMLGSADSALGVFSLMCFCVDAFVVVLSKDDRSLLDLYLGTRVYAPFLPPTLHIESPNE